MHVCVCVCVCVCVRMWAVVSVGVVGSQWLEHLIHDYIEGLGFKSLGQLVFFFPLYVARSSQRWVGPLAKSPGETLDTHARVLFDAVGAPVRLLPSSKGFVVLA